MQTAVEMYVLSTTQARQATRMWLINNLAWKCGKQKQFKHSEKLISLVLSRANL